jgi:hypothetical protein
VTSNGSQSELYRFLLIYRRRRAITLVVEAASLADALIRAEEFGCDRSQFRLGQALDPELATLVRSEQVNRALSPAEAKQLLAMFSAHFLS